MSETIKEHIETHEENQVRKNMINRAESQERKKQLETSEIYKISDDLFGSMPLGEINVSEYVNKKGEILLDIVTVSEMSDIKESLQIVGYEEVKESGVYLMYPIDEDSNRIKGAEAITQLSEKYLEIYSDAYFYSMRLGVIAASMKRTEGYFSILDDSENGIGSLNNYASSGALRIIEIEKFLETKAGKYQQENQILKKTFKILLGIILANNGERLLKQCSDVRFSEIDKISDEFEGGLVTKEEIERYYNTAFDGEKLEPFDPLKHKEEMRLISKDLKDRCYKAIDDREQAENELLKQQKNIQEHSHEEREELQTPIQGAIKWIKEQVGGIFE